MVTSETLAARHHRRMNDLGLAIHAHVRLHPEVPLLSLSRLMHLRVPALLAVSWSNWERESESRPRSFPVVIRTPWACKCRFTVPRISSPKFVFLQQVTEFAHRGFVWHRLCFPSQSRRNCRSVAESYSASFHRRGPPD